jgi:hypothetical protein
MRKIGILALALSFFGATFSSSFASGTTENKNKDTQKIYSEMNLKGIINYDTFEKAVQGYNQIKGKKKELLTIIDFSKPSTQERFYVLDMKSQKLLYKSVVTHGKNSGSNYATSFSNVNGSNKSSLGFYLTENTYNGRNGYSLRLDGLEPGINDKAKERAIVVHGADYANPEITKSLGRLGRSLGCPALPQKISADVINTIKNGSVMYIHANDQNYVAKSVLVS